jgi:hypothetical protein
MSLGQRTVTGTRTSATVEPSLALLSKTRTT